MLPVVMMMDISPWVISCVIGQLGQEEGIQSLPRNGMDPTVGNMEKAYHEACPVMFLSKVLDDTQYHWSQLDQEAYVIFWFLTQNGQLLLGSKMTSIRTANSLRRHFSWHLPM